MFTPVPMEEFYSSPVGEQFLAGHSPEDHAIAATLDWGMVREKMAAGQQPYEDDWNARRLAGFASWLTANYSEDTGVCTLYRGIDPPMVQDLENTGAFTSRTVQAFGNGNVLAAEQALRETAEGKLAEPVRQRIEKVLEHAALELDEELYWLFEDTHRLLEGTPSEATKSELLATAGLLAVVVKGGEGGYMAIMERARSEEDSPMPGSLHSLTYPSIHLTSDLSFIKDRVESGWFTHAVQVDFEPGSLQVAPEVGIIGNALLLPKRLPGFGEAEWYGIGKLDLSAPGVHGYSIEKIV